MFKNSRIESVNKIKNAKQIGQLGESIAQNFLEKKGYKILAKNYCIQGGELDLITLKNQHLIFFEIKTRHHFKFGEATETISFHQKASLVKTACHFLAMDLSSKYTYENLQFDLLVIKFESIADKKIAKIKHYKDIFAE